VKPICRILLVVALCLAGPTAAAGERTPENGLAIGKVRDFYFRVARYVFLERSSGLLPRGAPLEFWLDLQFAGDIADGRDVGLARLNDVQGVELGDLVEVDLADLELRAASRIRRSVAPIARQERVIAIAAKHFTPLALQFGRTPGATLRLGFSQRGHAY